MALTQVQGGMLQGSTNTTTTIQSNGTTAITIDSSQKVGIGTASPTGKLHVTQSGNPIAQFTRSDSGTGLVIASDSDGPYFRPETSSAIRFNNSANSAEYMRVASDGGIYLGTTTSGGANGITFSNASDSAAYGKSMYMNSPYNGTRNAISFAYNSSGVGAIVTGTSSTSYNTSSDYRLKEDIAPMTDALAKVTALKPCTYKWKLDGSDGQGFIAHELQAVVPECVTGEKDGVDEEGNPVHQGIDTSFLVATLTAAIQELKAELDATKAEVAALKGV